MRITGTRIMTAICILALFLAMPAAAFAESTSGGGSCYFDGSSIISDFSSEEIADAVTNLQPGDDVSFTVTYANRSGEKTDWYMANEVIRTLEKANSARKGVTSPGTGTPENGGYTYELIHTDKSGNRQILFSNREVGGDARPGGLQGLEQATNATDEWFYIQTLEGGESGSVTLNVEFEGETEVNDYMDTEGGVELKFAVEVITEEIVTKHTTVPTEAAEEPTKDEPTKEEPTKTPPDKPTKDTPEKKTPGKSVKTGDSVNPAPWTAAMIVSGLILLILAVISIRRDRKRDAEGGAEK